MEYFVSAGNKAYYHWQLELLIQSFKNYGIEDKLVIAISSSEEPLYKNFCKNLSKHEKIFQYDCSGSFGPERGLIGLHEALKTGMLSQPFTFMRSDMMLMHPLDGTQLEKDSNDYEIQFSYDPLMTLEHFRDHGIADDYSGGWMNLGNTLCLNNIDISFFEKLYYRMVDITSNKKKYFNDPDLPYKNKKVWEAFAEKVCWIITIMENMHDIKLKGITDLEVSLYRNYIPSFFIDYSDGLPPFFRKNTYKYKNNYFFTDFETPFEALSERFETTTTSYVSNIVRQYLKETKK
jgi:hypothetical protein